MELPDELNRILSKSDFNYEDTLVKLRLLRDNVYPNFTTQIIEYFKSYDEVLLFKALVKLTSKAGESSKGLPYEISKNELRNNVRYNSLQQLLNETFLRYFDENRRYLPLTDNLQNLINSIHDNREAFLNFNSDRAGILLLNLSLFYKIISLIFADDYKFIYGMNWIVPTKEKLSIRNHPSFFYLSSNKIFLAELKKWPDNSVKKLGGVLSVGLFLETLKASPALYQTDKKNITICFPYIESDLQSTENIEFHSKEENPYFKKLMDFISTIRHIKDLNLIILFFQLTNHHLDYLSQSIRKMPNLRKVSLTCYFENKFDTNYESVSEKIFTENSNLQELSIELLTNPNTDLLQTTDHMNGQKLETIHNDTKSFFEKKKNNQTTVSIGNHSVSLRYKNPKANEPLRINDSIEKFKFLINAFYSDHLRDIDSQSIYRMTIYLAALIFLETPVHEMPLAEKKLFTYSSIEERKKNNVKEAMEESVRIQELFINNIARFNNPCNAPSRSTFLEEIEKIIVAKPFLCVWGEEEAKNYINQIENLVGSEIWNEFSIKFPFNEDNIYRQLPSFYEFLNELNHEKLFTIVLSVVQHKIPIISPLKNYQATRLSQEEYNLCLEFFENKEHCILSKEKLEFWPIEKLRSMVDLLLHNILGERFHLIKNGIGILILENERKHASLIEKVLEEKWGKLTEENEATSQGNENNQTSKEVNFQEPEKKIQETMWIFKNQIASEESTKNLKLKLTMKGFERRATTLIDNNCLVDAIAQCINEDLSNQGYTFSMTPIQVTQLANQIKSELKVNYDAALSINIPQQASVILGTMRNYLKEQNIAVNFISSVYISDSSGDIGLIDNNDEISNLLPKISPSESENPVEIVLRILQVNYNHYEPLIQIEKKKELTQEIKAQKRPLPVGELDECRAEKKFKKNMDFHFYNSKQQENDTKEGVFSPGFQ